MFAFLASNSFVDFLNGNIFGYLLHAAQIVVAEFLFAISLKKRNHFYLRAIPATILYLALSVGAGLLFEKYFPYARYVSAFLFSIVLVAFCYGAKIWDDLFCIVAAIATQNLGYSIGVFIVGAIGWEPETTVAVSSIIQVIVYIAVHAAVFMLCYERLKDVNGAGGERMAMTVISLIVILVIYVLQLGKSSLYAEDFLQWRAMFIGYDLMMLFMLFGMYDRNKLRRENAILDTLRANAEKQYEVDKHAMEMINIKSHDLKHQLMALREMKHADLDHFLDEIEETTLAYDSVAKTGCKPLDVIISNKYSLCKKYGIRLTYMIDGKKFAFMKSSDIYSLFGNALDNAIRAENEVEDEDKRIINVTAVARNKILNIRIENYWERDVQFRNGLPVTTKGDDGNHGFGILSMKRIIEDYGGVMSVDVSGNMFSVNITVPIKETGK